MVRTEVHKIRGSLHINTGVALELENSMRADAVTGYPYEAWSRRPIAREHRTEMMMKRGPGTWARHVGQARGTGRHVGQAGTH